MCCLQLACDNAETFDAVNVATCLHRIAKNRPRDMQPVYAHPGYNLILTLVGRHLNRFQVGMLPCSLS